MIDDCGGLLIGDPTNESPRSTLDNSPRGMLENWPRGSWFGSGDRQSYNTGAISTTSRPNLGTVITQECQRRQLGVSRSPDGLNGSNAAESPPGSVGEWAVFRSLSPRSMEIVKHQRELDEQRTDYHEWSQAYKSYLESDLMAHHKYTSGHRAGDEAVVRRSRDQTLSLDSIEAEAEGEEAEDEEMYAPKQVVEEDREDQDEDAGVEDTPAGLERPQYQRGIGPVPSSVRGQAAVAGREGEEALKEPLVELKRRERSPTLAYRSLDDAPDTDSTDSTYSLSSADFKGFSCCSQAIIEVQSEEESEEDSDEEDSDGAAEEDPTAFASPTRGAKSTPQSTPQTCHLRRAGPEEEHSEVLTATNDTGFGFKMKGLHDGLEAAELLQRKLEAALNLNLESGAVSGAEQLQHQLEQASHC